MATSAASTGPGESNSPAASTASAKDAVADNVSGAVDTGRARTGSLQAALADLFESSAQTIRSRAVSAGDRAGGAVGDGTAERLVQSGEATAAVLERGAMWLRENDLRDVEARLTHQIQDHPTRALLVAAGVGFLLGRRRG
jgi:ElaB/YqjD/DUF883 family membrane-anchored ribosome-binding protein